MLSYFEFGSREIYFWLLSSTRYKDRIWPHGPISAAQIEMTRLRERLAHMKRAL